MTAKMSDNSVEIDGRKATFIVCSQCGSPKANTLFTRHQFHYQQCDQCGLVHVNPQLSQQAIANLYREAYENKSRSHGKGSLTIPIEHQLLLEKLASIAGKAGKLLDVGCFEGQFLWAAREGGWQVTGTEISQTAVFFARETWQLDVHLGALEEVHFEDNQFDAVVLRDVIEHLPDPRCTLEEINRILRPGGAFYVWTPNFNSLTRRLVGQHWGAVIFPWHLYYFTPQSLVQMSKGTGFSPIKLSSRNLLLDFRDRYIALKEGKRLAGKRPFSKRISRLLDKLSQPLFALGDQHRRYWGAQIEMYARKEEL